MQFSCWEWIALLKMDKPPDMESYRNKIRSD